MSFIHPVVAFREKIAERLLNNAVANKGAVLTHKAPDLVNKVEEILGRVGGLMTLVRIVSAREKGAQTIRTQYDVRFSIECTEKAALNNTGIDAWSLAFAVGDELKIATISDGALKGLITFDEADIDDITPSSTPSILSIGVPFSAVIAGVPRSTTN